MHKYYMGWSSDDYICIVTNIDTEYKYNNVVLSIEQFCSCVSADLLLGKGFFPDSLRCEVIKFITENI